LSNGSTLLLGLEGMVVTAVRLGADGSRVITVGTSPEWVGRCTECQVRSTESSRGWVTIRPRDIKIGPDRPQIVWRKRKWLCTNTSCEKKAFT
jgi:transposase